MTDIKEAQGLEVVRLGFDIRPYTTGLGLVEKPDGDYVWFTQHHRLLEEAKQGQRVLAMEVERLKAEVEQEWTLRRDMEAQRDTAQAVAAELRAQLAAQAVVYQCPRCGTGMEADPTAKPMNKGAKPVKETAKQQWDEINSRRCMVCGEFHPTGNLPCPKMIPMSNKP